MGPGGDLDRDLDRDLGFLLVADLVAVSLSLETSPSLEESESDVLNEVCKSFLS